MNLTSHSAKELAKIIGGESILVQPDLRINNLLFDSRKDRQFSATLFIALDGDFRDGHRFVMEMYKKGVRNFLVSQSIDTIPEANVFKVKSTIETLQKIGKHQRSTVAFPVIGIAGSTGKTIVKEWLYQLLNADYDIVRSPKSYNSQIGVPLSVWAMNEAYNLGIFETGISQLGEMKKLEEIIQPTLGIFTNILQTDQEGFSSMEEKRKEELRLFDHSEYIVYCADSRVSGSIIENKFPKEKRLSWGRSTDCFLKLTAKTSGQFNTVIHAVWKGENIKISIPFLDDVSIEDAMHCWVTMLHLGVTQAEIEKRFLDLESISMRLEQKNGVDGSILIEDAYNADIAAFEMALDSLAQVNRRVKTVILSDILKSGVTSNDVYKKINQSLVDHTITRFIGIGKELHENQDLITIPNKHFFVHTQHFLDELHLFDFENNSILIKGARDFDFERVTEKLASKNHQTQLEINLDALQTNLRYYKGKLLPKVKIMVMVKAFGYGAGGPEVARLLASEEVSYLGVAYADEGVAIRKAGISTPIMVMNPSSEAFSSMISYNLEPEIYSLSVLKAFNEALIAEGILNSDFKVHLKLDTGMNRLGFKEEDVADVLRMLKRETHFKVGSVFSHLAASDDPKWDDFTNNQISEFEELASQIESSLGYSVTKHICNTGGIERFKNAQYDMVRLGVGLYGMAIDPQNHDQLEVVSSLFSIVVQVKKVSTGESIGYGRNFMVEKPMKIAIIPIGYADGLDRRLGNGVGYVYVSGKKRKILGNICMDLIMVDVTGLPTQVNERVELFGQNIRVQDIAQQINTISYEILTSIPPRVKRVYIKETV